MRQEDHHQHTAQPSLFFYVTLKSGTPEEVQDMFRGLQRESEDVIDAAISIVYFMRGGLTFECAMNQITPGIRQKMSDFIGRRIKSESAKMNPIY